MRKKIKVTNKEKLEQVLTYLREGLSIEVNFIEDERTSELTHQVLVMRFGDSVLTSDPEPLLPKLQVSALPY